MYLVNVAVERPPMKCPMAPIVPCILYDEEDRNLVRHFIKWGKGNACFKAEVNCQGMDCILISKPFVGKK